MPWPTAAGRLPGRCEKPGVDPGYLSCCWRMKTRRDSYSQAGVRSVSCPWAGLRFQFVTRGHIDLRRLDDHDAIGPSDRAGGRERARSSQASPDGPRFRNRAATDKRSILDLYLDAGTPFGRATSRAFAVSRFQSTYFGKEPKRLYVGGYRRCWWRPAAIAGKPPPRSLPRCPRGSPRDRVLDSQWSRMAAWRARDAASGEIGFRLSRDAQSRCRSSRRIPPIRRWPPLKDTPVIALTVGFRSAESARGAWRAKPRDRAGCEHFGCHHCGRQ